MGYITCKRCQHRWLRRTPEKPKSCPRCKSYDWDKVKEVKKEEVQTNVRKEKGIEMQPQL